MKKILLLLAIAVYAAACSSYGDHYKVNDNSTIYYKDGMTEGDAKILGNFLVKNGYFDSTSDRSVQLGVQNGTINVKFATDKAKVSEDIASAEALFMIMGTAISTEVFGGRPLKIVLADQLFEGYRDIAVPGTSTGDPVKE